MTSGISFFAMAVIIVAAAFVGRVVLRYGGFRDFQSLSRIQSNYENP